MYTAITNFCHINNVPLPQRQSGCQKQGPAPESTDCPCQQEYVKKSTFFSVGVLTVAYVAMTKISPVRSLSLSSSCVAGILHIHCTENSKQILTEMKLCVALFPISTYIHGSVSDLYILTISPQTQYSIMGGPTVGAYKSLTDT